MSQDLRQALEKWANVNGIGGMSGVQDLLALVMPVLAAAEESAQTPSSRTRFKLNELLVELRSRLEKSE